jgi:hypothetical protein
MADMLSTAFDQIICVYWDLENTLVFEPKQAGVKSLF